MAPQAAIHAGVLCVATVATIGDAMTMTYAVSGDNGYVAGFPLVLPARVTLGIGSDTTCTLGTVDL